MKVIQASAFGNEGHSGERFWSDWLRRGSSPAATLAAHHAQRSEGMEELVGVQVRKGEQPRELREGELPVSDRVEHALILAVRLGAGVDGRNVGDEGQVDDVHAEAYDVLDEGDLVKLGRRGHEGLERAAESFVVLERGRYVPVHHGAHAREADRAEGEDEDSDGAEESRRRVKDRLVGKQVSR